MTNDERSPNVKSRIRHSSFGLLSSFGIRHSSFSSPWLYQVPKYEPKHYYSRDSCRKRRNPPVRRQRAGFVQPQSAAQGYAGTRKRSARGYLAHAIDALRNPGTGETKHGDTVFGGA